MSIISEYAAIKKLLRQRHAIVFYSESRYYYQYFERLIGDLLSHTSLTIIYITSDGRDPSLSISSPRMEVYLVKHMLGFLFPRLKADIMILTLTDLNNYQLKKSSTVGCYLYVFHAAVSVHQQYSTKAFFHYDSFLCPATYHRQELSRLSEVYGLGQKELISYGYPMLDKLEQRNHKANDPPIILVAPSWHDQCIFDTCAEPLMESLATFPCRAIIRAHPEYLKRRRGKYQKIKRRAESFGMIVDETSSIYDSLSSADLLITDRSGIALEFCFGIYKPVLFVETPPKIMNKDWRKIGLTPMEDQIRRLVGATIEPDRIHAIGISINDLLAKNEDYKTRLRKMKQDLFYNSENSYHDAIRYIISKTSR